MLLDILVWLALAALACVGGVVQMVAVSVRELEPTLIAAQETRLFQYRAGGAALYFGALTLASGWTAWVAIDAGLGPTSVALATGLSVLVVLLVQETVRTTAHAHLDQLARPLLGDAAVFLPLIEPHPEVQEPEEAKEEAVEQMVEAGEKVGLIESDEHQMISGVIGLDTTLVREIMVPRIDVVAIEVGISLRAALDVIIGGSHSRVPVYEESIDHIVGLLYAKDVLRTMRDGKMDTPTREMLRPAYFVPETKPLDELLQELQASQVHMAVVVDEYGGTAGIVTIEDVLEEIVGEIQDEYDIGEEPLIERLGEDEGIFDARVSVDEVNKTLGIDLPDESDTLAGLVYQRLQKIAKAGDKVFVDDVALVVLGIVGRRIKKVRVSKQTVEVRGPSPEQGPAEKEQSQMSGSELPPGSREQGPHARG